MKGLNIGKTLQWSLSSFIGYEHSFFTINVTSVLHTWIILIILLLILLPIKWLLTNTHIGRFLILSFVNFFINLTQQATETFSFDHFSFITALFSFIFICNIISIIPWLEEPTQDLNTALALGIVSFLYVQGASIKSQGIAVYMKDFFSPFLFMFPLNLVGKLGSIISISFRLFGNIFGSSIITKIYFGAIQGSILAELAGLFSGINILLIGFFTLFEGFLQAFVFTMLTLTYLSIGLKKQES